MNHTPLTGQPETEPITKVADLRDIPLGQLTRHDVHDATRLVLPGDDTERVAVAAFQSSI